jgi:DnaK suppressor protein
MFFWRASRYTGPTPVHVGVRNERLFFAPAMRAAIPMNALDEGQLAQLRAALEAQLAALSRTDEPRQANGARDLPVSEVETSPADKATVRLLNDLALEAAGHHAARMQVLRRALAKFKDGSYGLCEECGGDIGFSRLQARPEARLCIACQTRYEKR